MAIRPLNSVGGFAVGELANIVILSNGVITTTTANLTANLVANAIYSDNYKYANGTAVDFQTAAGNATEVQFKSSTGDDLEASANFTFDTTTSLLSVTGDINATSNVAATNFTGSTITVTDATISGNLSVGGTLTYINSTSLDIKDPIIELGGGPDGAALTEDDNLDRGTLLHYHDGSNPVDAFIGWDNSNSEITLASNVALTDGVITVNKLANVRADRFIGDGSLLTNIPATAISGVTAEVSSNITNIVAGSAVGVSMDYTDPAHPAGKFVIYQLGPVSLGVVDVWQSSNAISKNAYANYLAGAVNTSDVTMTFSLANANFNIQSTDTITIGSSVVTGANLVALGLTGSSGTYTIPSAYLAANVQTNPTSVVAANLTTTRGIYTGNGITLTTAQPVAYNINSIAGSFPSSSIPFWNLNQAFNWNVSLTGTTISGNLTYSGGAISTTSLSSSGGVNGSSGSINSSSSYTITTSDYTGSGLNGYGTRIIPATVNGTVAAASKYYPLFWKITSSNILPTFTVTDSRNSNNYATGQSANTSNVVSNYLYLAIPNSGNATPLQSRTFKHVFGAFDIVDVPSVTGTQTISANGESYNYSIYGFSGFTQTSSIIVTS